MFSFEKLSFKKYKSKSGRFTFEDSEVSGRGWSLKKLKNSKVTKTHRNQNNFLGLVKLIQGDSKKWDGRLSLQGGDKQSVPSESVKCSLSTSWN